MTQDPMERLLASLKEDLHQARLANKVAAIVTDTCRENLEVVFKEREDTHVPIEVVGLMLEGILAALSGKTDWSELHVIHPDVTPLAFVRIQSLLNGSTLTGRQA